jgi:protein-S-isoprenylcysteine O-methyltransferase Ste14
VAVQAVLLAAVLLSALVGGSWPGRLAPAAFAVGAVLTACGAALLVAGGIGLGAGLTPFPAPRAGGGLRTAGVYRLARQPMYGGGILLGLGWSTIFASLAGLVLTAVLAVFADAKSRREELWLERAFPGYADYRRRTRRRLVPFVW